MAGDINVTIASLEVGQGYFSSLAGEFAMVAEGTQADCEKAVAATAGWGPLGAALTGAGTKLAGALGLGENMGIAGMMRLTSTKLGQCAQAYASTEAQNSHDLSIVDMGPYYDVGPQLDFH